MTFGSNNPQNTDGQDKYQFFTCFGSEILYVFLLQQFMKVNMK